MKLEISLNGEPRAGEWFEFVASSNRRLARVVTYVDRSRIWEVNSVDAPHFQRVFIGLRAAGKTLRIQVFDNIGNTIEEQRMIGAPAGSPQQLMASMRVGCLRSTYFDGNQFGVHLARLGFFHA